MNKIRQSYGVEMLACSEESVSDYQIFRLRHLNVEYLCDSRIKITLIEFTQFFNLIFCKVIHFLFFQIPIENLIIRVVERGLLVILIIIKKEFRIFRIRQNFKTV